jgi:hypothetical protein
MKGGGILGVAGGNWGRPGAPQRHRQPPVEPPSPDSTDPKIFNILERGVHLIKIKDA